MIRHRKIDEDVWDEDEEHLAVDHVVERFFSRHERHADEGPRRHRSGAKQRRRQGSAAPDADEGPPSDNTAAAAHRT